MCVSNATQGCVWHATYTRCGAGAPTLACFWPARRTRSNGADPRYHYSWRAWEGLSPSIVVSTSRRMFICLFPGSRVTTDQRVVAKQEIQEVESAKRLRTIVTRRKTQTRSCGRNLRMRPERGDTETRGPRGLGKGDVRGVVEAVLGEHLPKPTRREEVTLRRGSKL